MIQKHTRKINIGIAILAVLLIFALAMVPAQGATKKSKTGWKKSGSYTYYYYKSGKYYKNRFATIKGSKYYYIGNSAYLKASAVKVIASK